MTEGILPSNRIVNTEVTTVLMILGSANRFVFPYEPQAERTQFQV